LLLAIEGIEQPCEALANAQLLQPFVAATRRLRRPQPEVQL
jgi:hypothetical protein